MAPVALRYAPCLRRDCLVAELKAQVPLNWSPILLARDGTSQGSAPVAAPTSGSTWAYVCVATGNAHARGCAVVLRSIARTGTPHVLHALLGPGESVGKAEIEALHALGAVTSKMERTLQVRSESHWSTLSASKFGVWRLEQYDKILFVDADVVVLKPLDSLFDLVDKPGMIAAPQDPVYLVTGPPALVTSLFVAVPSVATYEELVETMVNDPAYKTNSMSDSRVARSVFSGSKWVEIPPQYHMSSWMFEVRHIPAQRLLNAAHSIHYSGGNKPLYSGVFGGVSSCTSSGRFLWPLWAAMRADAVHPRTKVDPLVVAG
ncbi:uncharacterized protein AMSG_08331 [Thecamonas trahens ATCC 50062]|uniref:Hexosyltransferase n=1 Tax=Thecamonas trahens ATCC 50062 TaxID=461836 RepID=A0A0L0DLT6_THETB|nr:hypothetical protein AMSG_08331 [Thecamonas trahens ATCC 50062]KNC52358.1 hypothetical protein AMSG_08331 [Thecamonas trahens ATCC 50062]|eukprot:XP_013755407.1 hypothetical protein AMSG_08331 [Thecamonas trahens ATCC 50062]